MQHCDEETLSLFALGEPAPAEVQAHLASCEHCESELAALQLVVTAARDLGPDGGPGARVAPPAQVWEQIAAATGVSTQARHPEVVRHAAPGSSPRVWLSAGDRSKVLRRVRGNDRPDSRSAALGRPRRVAPARGPGRLNRPNRSMLIVAAAALVVGLLGGGLGTWLVTGRSSSTTAPTQLVVAETALAGLPLAPGAAGQADVVKTAQGRELELDVHQLAAPDGFYEVWLIDRTITKMVPIGVLSGGRGQFSLPAGVDLNSYPLVDISIQPLNGDPKHSGRSVLRGTLRS